jgi:iron(III) transport system permease protein
VADTGSLRRVAWLAAAGLAALIIGWPLARLFGVATERGVGAVADTLGGSQATSAIWNSLWTGALVAVLAVTWGTVGALLTERSDLPGRRWLRAGILVPLVVPPFVAAFGWARAFGPRGLSDQVLGLALPGLYGPLGIVVVLTVAATPLAYLVVAGALASRVEPDLERAARASGATWFETLLTVTLPLLRPAFLSALVVVFVFAINAFGVPAVLGTPAGFATITTRLYQDLARSADPASFVRATTMAATLVVIALVVVGSADALLTGRSAARTALPAGGGLARGRRVASLLLTVVIVVTTVLPLVAVVLSALTRATGLAPVPANWTLDNFAVALDPRFLGGLAHSLVLAVSAATISLGLGALGVAGIARRSRGLGTAITLGFAVPGSALAVAVLLAYGGWLRDTLVIILVAYVAKFWALGHRQLAGSVERLPRDQVHAARASGAGVVDAFRSVIVPALRPSIVAAWLVVFVFALHELTMSSLLYGPGSATLAVIVLNVQQLGDPTITAAMAVLLVGVVAIAAIPLAFIGGRQTRRADPELP